MFKKWFFILFILITGGILAFSLITKTLNKLSGVLPASLQNFFQEKEIDLGETQDSNQEFNQYFFDKDSDEDKLADAWEIIFGTNPTQKDTDKDGFQDGDEVKNGFDPAFPQKRKIEENPDYINNLTIRYFLWIRNQINLETDSWLQIEKAAEFLDQKLSKESVLPRIADSEIKINNEDSKEAVQLYFDSLLKVPLPPVSSAYLQIADEALKGDTRNLEKAINQLDFVISQYKNISALKPTVELHKNYLGMFLVSRDIFSNIYKQKEDPLQFMYDLKRGTLLAEIGKELENKGQEISNKYSQ